MTQGSLRDSGTVLAAILSLWVFLFLLTDTHLRRSVLQSHVVCLGIDEEHDACTRMTAAHRTQIIQPLMFSRIITFDLKYLCILQEHTQRDTHTPTNTPPTHTHTHTHTYPHKQTHVQKIHRHAPQIHTNTHSSTSQVAEFSQRLALRGI